MMIKGLEAVKEIKEKYKDDDGLQRRLGIIIEKELRALKIIVEKRVDADYLADCGCVEEYNDRMDELCRYPEKRYLTSSEFNSIKEVML